MKKPPRLVEDAHTDAIGAVHAIPGPELEAFFWIRIPLQDPMLIRYGRAFPGHISAREGLRGAVFRALLANLAHRFNAEWAVCIGCEGQVCKNFA